MADIQVRDLTSIAGADLFSDSESFMQYLSTNEIDLQGGRNSLQLTPIIPFSTFCKRDPRPEKFLF